MEFFCFFPSYSVAGLSDRSEKFSACFHFIVVVVSNSHENNDINGRLKKMLIEINCDFFSSFVDCATSCVIPLPPLFVFDILCHVTMLLIRQVLRIHARNWHKNFDIFSVIVEQFIQIRRHLFNKYFEFEINFMIALYIHLI